MAPTALARCISGLKVYHFVGVEQGPVAPYQIDITDRTRQKDFLSVVVRAWNGQKHLLNVNRQVMDTEGIHRVLGISKMDINYRLTLFGFHPFRQFGMVWQGFYRTTTHLGEISISHGHVYIYKELFFPLNPKSAFQQKCACNANAKFIYYVLEKSLSHVYGWFSEKVVYNGLLCLKAHNSLVFH